ncbi:hypothetical protein ACGF5C_34070 [Micromonospora sp. NPDC047620]|uniref:hypothetical protein n=1 Tax=Micromonospora sp. NPDC047620 TaxID=3364251 RepID=UPI003721F36C
MQNTHDSGHDRYRPEEFWTLSTTSMTQQEAEEAAQLIRERFPEVFANAVDPGDWMTLHLDRTTAEMLRDAVAMFVSAGGDAGNMLEEFERFLAIANAGDREG